MHPDDDPRLIAEMAVCDHYRIPHSEFLRWDEEDRAKAIWYLFRQRSTCASCGIRPEDANLYEPQMVMYHCCQKRERAEAELSRQSIRGARIVMAKPEVPT